MSIAIIRKLLPVCGMPNSSPAGGARDLAAHDHPIAGDEHFLDVELHDGN